MKNLLLLSLFFVFSFISASAQKTDSTAVSDELKKVLERDKAIQYKTGKVSVNSEVELSVPDGYKFMPKADAEFVVFDYWGNPRSENLLGMIVKKDFTILNPDLWAFVVTYENDGFVKDEDAADIDYDEMMSNMQSEEEEGNEERKKAGYEPIHMIGWAAKPYYDNKNNILHWAKSMTFGNSADTTLNYDVRILGRKGVLSLNAVGTVGQLNDIKTHIPDIVHIAKFKEGSRYADFDPDIDQVAAYSIGGLVAGKLLAKAGLLALLLKNIKLVLIAVGVAFGGARKWIASLFSKKGKTEEPPFIAENESGQNDVSEGKPEEN